MGKLTQGRPQAYGQILPVPVFGKLRDLDIIDRSILKRFDMILTGFKVENMFGKAAFF